MYNLQIALDLPLLYRRQFQLDALVVSRGRLCRRLGRRLRASDARHTRAPLAIRAFCVTPTVRPADGVYNLKLSLYTTPLAGDALHTETFTNVPVRAGVFSVVVGDTTALPANLFSNSAIYLGITVDDGVRLRMTTRLNCCPRQQLHAVPWAFQAANAVTANIATTAATANTADTANTATTANNLQPGGGVLPGPGDLSANGLKEIALPERE